MRMFSSDVLRRARKIVKDFETPDDAIRSIVHIQNMDDVKLISNATVCFWKAEWDWDRAIILALFDEVKKVVDSGTVDSFEIALATVPMTHPEQVAVVALAERKMVEISESFKIRLGTGKNATSKKEEEK